MRTRSASSELGHFAATRLSATIACAVGSTQPEVPGFQGHDFNVRFRSLFRRPIFAMTVLIWFLASFPQPPVGAVEPAINYSLAAIIGKAIAPLLSPLGFNWQIAVALIPGMAAREVAVAALGTVYAI